jgi:hypothetical protein
MGNEDGFLSAVANQGTNQVIKFNGGYFSFAMGNEIALILEDRRGKYFILNCSSELFEEVKKEIKKTNGDKNSLIAFWIKKSKKYQISDWSTNFKELKN